MRQQIGHFFSAQWRAEIDQFTENGYMVFPGFFQDSWNKTCREVLDEWALAGRSTKRLLPHPLFSALVFDKAVLSVVRSLLGRSFLFHHANGRALPPTDAGKPWHHDYDGTKPWGSEEPMMIHLMGYPSGLDDAMGPLVLQPGSHHALVPREYPNKHGFSSLSGEIVVTGRSGLLVVINSALWHHRRPNDSQRTRHYFNLSYCQFGAPRPERVEQESVLRELRDTAHGVEPNLSRMLTQSDTLTWDDAQ